MLTAKHPFQCFKLLCLSWVCPAPLRKQQKWDRPPREHTPTFALGTIKIPPGLSGYVPRHWENSKSGTGQEIYPSLCSLHNYVSLYCLHILCCWVNSISGTESKCPTPGATHLRKQTKNATAPLLGRIIWHIFTGDSIGHSFKKWLLIG